MIHTPTSSIIFKKAIKISRLFKYFYQCLANEKKIFIFLSAIISIECMKLCYTVKL